ncbi:YhgE/Pip domain-containing protein [Methanobrevibacter sp.]|uniref:YhgE/Pip domain-containing protein n=1 Tax=Methanobrevibacter sp. TaxID=66852 RepID=UPI0025FFB326|nr:YhgE/Pip domain-containing protein [Methanobrevibacter sp.]MBR4448131.1 YhgE/Pip domain-containing protein [Methanobrevibacter sp.]
MSGRDLGNIIEIIKNDFKAAFSNPIVTFVLIALIILPSLYALINIQACWDPYGNTGDVQFAIANLDNGSSFEGKQLNIGNELVKDLKNNDKFDWTFVTEDELREGVYKGDYYAGIVIPKNLTENVLSITTDDPQQAKLEYIVNMKANPVAAKLTDSASNAVYLSLNAKIVEIINLAAYGKLGELQEGLASGASKLASGGNQLAAGSAKVASGASQVQDGADQVKDGASQVKDGASQVEKGADKVQKGVPAVNKGANDVKKGSSAVQEGASQVEKGSEEIQSAIDPSVIPEGPVKEYVEGNVKLANGSGQVAEGASKLAGGSASLAEGSSKLANGSGQVAGGASKVAGGASDLADGSVELAEGSLALAAGSQLLSNGATQALFTASGALASSAESLAGITGINETILGEYFYSPIKLDRHELFPVPDYGSQVAPFYLVLSMWVGALITNTMLRPGISEGTKYSPLEMYFGKLALFLAMAVLQALVTVTGSIILGIYITNLPLFTLSAILVSVVFMALIYSLSSALGNVGKGIAIILLLFQISGTGGIYPIEIMGTLFKTLYPFLPMTYGIDLMREAQLGLIWSNYWPALVMLIGIGLATEVVSLIIKEKADKAAHYFEKRLDESGLF